MHDLLVFPSLLTAGLFLYWIVRAADAFERLCWADRTQAYRLASYCGVNPCGLPEQVLPSHGEGKFYRWARS